MAPNCPLQYKKSKQNPSTKFNYEALFILLPLHLCLSMSALSDIKLPTTIPEKPARLLPEPFYNRKLFVNVSQTSCQSFITFRSQPPYDSPISIAHLLTSDATGIAFINNISPTSHIPPGKLIIVPLSCSCPRGFYQHNTVYTIQGSETAFTIANDTYQSLTSCRAVQGEFIDQNLLVGFEVIVQLKCACPSTNQTANGVISLLQYLVTWGDTVESIANLFGVDAESILEANMISQDSVFYPFTSLFIPLKNDSCLINPQNFFCYNCPADFPRDARLQASTCNHGKKFPVKIVTLLGIGIGLGLLCMCLSGYMLYRFLKNRKYKMRKEKLFKQNGGFLLQQRLLDYGCSERAKIITEEELQKATDNCNQSRFLGQGGFDTVYKGMLPDGNVVTVKRSKAIDKSQIEQFINEVVILSQVNHRNIVKLLGCCLETEVPVLAYEFIPNGTLSHHIHHHQQEQEQEYSLSWDNRVRIACEVAGAVAYMHSAASIPIFHRDIKSSNILLDEKYSAKISDFGSSRSIPNDKTHLTTAVQGTLGYLDPEYFQSSQFTEKSDAYSFGVVLVELLTGKTPFSYARAEEKNLVTCFISLAKENQLLEILDTRVAKEAREEDIQSIAELVMRCLRLNGKKRPTMKEVATELEGLIRSQRSLEIDQDQEPEERRGEMLHMETSEETEQGSIEDSSEFSLQLESKSL